MLLFVQCQQRESRRGGAVAGLDLARAAKSNELNGHASLPNIFATHTLTHTHTHTTLVVAVFVAYFEATSLICYPNSYGCVPVCVLNVAYLPKTLHQQNEF